MPIVFKIFQWMRLPLLSVFWELLVCNCLQSQCHFVTILLTDKCWSMKHDIISGNSQHVVGIRSVNQGGKKLTCGGWSLWKWETTTPSILSAYDGQVFGQTLHEQSALVLVEYMLWPSHGTTYFTCISLFNSYMHLHEILFQIIDWEINKLHETCKVSKACQLRCNSHGQA